MKDEAKEGYTCIAYNLLKYDILTYVISDFLCRSSDSITLTVTKFVQKPARVTSDRHFSSSIPDLLETEVGYTYIERGK